MTRRAVERAIQAMGAAMDAAPGLTAKQEQAFLATVGQLHLILDRMPAPDVKPGAATDPGAAQRVVVHPEDAKLLARAITYAANHDDVWAAHELERMRRYANELDDVEWDV